jgi:hypothetical protein
MKVGRLTSLLLAIRFEMLSPDFEMYTYHREEVSPVTAWSFYWHGELRSWSEVRKLSDLHCSKVELKPSINAEGKIYEGQIVKLDCDYAILSYGAKTGLFQIELFVEDV